MVQKSVIDELKGKALMYDMLGLTSRISETEFH